MTTTTDPMPTSHEAALLTGGQLIPALLQAVRDQGIAPRDAHFAFPLAVPMVAARLNLSARSILVVTESGAALYGPGGETIADLCEQEALGVEGELSEALTESQVGNEYGVLRRSRPSGAWEHAFSIATPDAAAKTVSTLADRTKDTEYRPAMRTVTRSPWSFTD